MRTLFFLIKGALIYSTVILIAGCSSTSAVDTSTQSNHSPPQHHHEADDFPRVLRQFPENYGVTQSDIKFGTHL